MDNVAIARALEEVADLLEIQGANPFRIRAYRNAVRTIEAQPVQLARLLGEGRPLTELPGIGKEMAGHVRELVETGTLGFRDALIEEIPRSLVPLMRLPGLGARKAKRLLDELGIGSVEELEAAAREGRIAALPGFGEKSQARILAGIEEHRQHSARVDLPTAERRVEPLLAWLRAAPGVERLEVAGSFRRRCETIGDVDLLAIAADPGPVARRLLDHPQVEKVLMAGDTRVTVVLGSGLQVDLRVVPRESWGAALVYFTGSKEHNVRLRRRGAERGLRISEYGVFRTEGDAMATRAVHVPGQEVAEALADRDAEVAVEGVEHDRGRLACRRTRVRALRRFVPALARGRASARARGTARPRPARRSSSSPGRAGDRRGRALGRAARPAVRVGRR